MNSEALQSYAVERGRRLHPSYGEAALERAMPVVIAEACSRVTRGEAVDGSLGNRHRLPRGIIAIRRGVLSWAPRHPDLFQWSTLPCLSTALALTG